MGNWVLGIGDMFMAISTDAFLLASNFYSGTIYPVV